MYYLIYYLKIINFELIAIANIFLLIRVITPITKN